MTRDFQESPALEQVPAEPILFRSSNVTDVNYSQRVIEFVAAPYDEEAVVMWRGQAWRELFLRGAWDGIEKRPTRIKVNREHNKMHTVGKIVNFWPSREEGLVGAAKIAQTPLGDETLALASEDCLGASVGYAALPRDVELDKRVQPGLRRVKRAYMDHMALTVEPSYAGATVLSVRSGLAPADDLAPLVETPALDELRSWLQGRRG
jgi:phage head maturation protease